MADFAAELAQRAELGHAPPAQGVTLASMHAAKGLEWDAVLLPGLVEGLMPIVHAKTPRRSRRKGGYRMWRRPGRASTCTFPGRRPGAGRGAAR